jgi:hypothetical protein
MRIVLEISKQNNRFWFTENTLGVLKYHRDNDMPAMIFGDNEKRWYVNGNLIREEISWETLLED